MTPSMRLERDYTIVYFGDTIQPTLKARPPFPHKPHRELKGRTEKPKEKRITRGDLTAEKKTTRGDLTAPINKLGSHSKTSQKGKKRDQRRKKNELRTGEKTTMT